MLGFTISFLLFLILPKLDTKNLSLYPIDFQTSSIILTSQSIHKHYMYRNIYPFKYFYFEKKIQKNFYIHRLVAIAFIENPYNKKTVNHKDGNKLNNHVSNLEWATRSEQELHAFKNNLKQSVKGEKHRAAKLKEYQVIEIFNLCKNSGLNNTEISKLYNISDSMVCCIKYKRHWKYLLKDL